MTAAGYVEMEIGDAPATPGTNRLRVYGKSDKKIYAKNADGTEYDLTAGSGSGTVTSVGSGTGLVGGPITTSGTLSIMPGTTAGDRLRWTGSAWEVTQPDHALIASGENGATAAISLTSIPSTFRHLRLLVVGRSAVAATADTILLQVNGVTAATNYYAQLDSSSGTTPAAAQNIAATATLCNGSWTGNNAAANIFSVLDVTFYDYAQTTKIKMCTWQNFVATALSSGNIFTVSGGGYYNSTSAITQIDTTGSGANLVQYSSWRLYGLK